MAIEDLDVTGPWPDFEGKTLEQLVAQESWFEGERDDEANVVWFRVGGDWYKLYFDGDAVFWKANSHGPGERPASDEEAEQFPIVDLSDRFGLAGKTMTGCDGDFINDASEVRVRFEDGAAITFRNRFDRTTVVMAADGVTSS